MMRILHDNEIHVNYDNDTLSLQRTDEEITQILNIYLKILFGCVFVTLILLAFVGNTLVCVAIFWDRQLREQTENLFLVSLAFSDALLSVLVIIGQSDLSLNPVGITKTVKNPFERTSVV